MPAALGNRETVSAALGAFAEMSLIFCVSTAQVDEASATPGPGGRDAATFFPAASYGHLPGLGGMTCGWWGRACFFLPLCGLQAVHLAGNGLSISNGLPIRERTCHPLLRGTVLGLCFLLPCFRRLETGVLRVFSPPGHVHVWKGSAPRSSAC